MGDWVTTNILKPYVVITCKPRDTININQYGIKFTSPKFIYGYTKVKGTSVYWDSTVSITFNSSAGTIYVGVDNSINKSESELVILVYEDSMNTNVNNLSGSWTNCGVIKKIGFYTLSSSNNHTVTLNDYDMSNIAIIPILSNVNFGGFSIGYNTNITVSGNTIKSVLSSKTYSGTINKVVKSAPWTYTLSKDCYAFSCMSFAYNEGHHSYVGVKLNNTQLYWDVADNVIPNGSGVSAGSYAGTVDMSISNILTYTEGSNYKNETHITEYLLTDTTSVDNTISIIVIEKM